MTIYAPFIWGTNCFFMKLYRILCLVFLLFVCVTSVLPQTVAPDQSDRTIQDVLHWIKENTTYKVWYRNEEMDLERKVRIKLNNRSVTDILNEILAPQGLSFNISGNYIVVFKIEEASQEKSMETYQVTGIVTDENGEAIIGANVTVSENRQGTITNDKGQFSLFVPVKAHLEVSFIGYVTQQVLISKPSALKIRLREDSNELSEVVVTALGIKRSAKALGYSVSSIGGQAISATHPISMVSSLSGKVAGVDVLSGAAGPSGSVRVNIRGNAELSGYNQPLFVIDGMPMDNSQLGEANMWGGYDLGDGISSLNPEDIESLTVLKGASASALYGSRATHGVILITTKSATKKGIHVELSSSTDFITQLSTFDDYQRVYGMGRNGELADTYEKGRLASQIAWGAKLDPNLYVTIFNGKEKVYTNVEDNISSFYRTGATFNNTLSLTSGSDKLNVRASVSDMRNRDIVPGSDMRKNSFSVRAIVTATPKLKFDARLNYFLENVNNRPALSDSPNNVGLSLIGLAPNFDQHWLKDGYKDEYGRYVEWNGDNKYRINPYWTLNEMYNKSRKKRFMGYMQATYELIPGLTAQLRGGTDFYRFRITEYQGLYTPTAPDGAMAENLIDVNETNIEGLLRYTGRLGANMDISAFMGGNMMFYDQEAFYNTGEQQITPGVHSITNYMVRNKDYVHPRKRINSLYGSVNLGYKNYLYLDLTLRNDWSSTLIKEHNSYMYPSVSLSFIFSEFIRNRFLNFGKLRASWAQVGGDTAPYKLNLNYGLQPGSFNDKPLGEISSTSIPKQDLLPTRTESYELGIDTRMLNNRLRLDASFYVQRTRDQIMDLPISETTGFEYATINSGEIRNQGIELSLGIVPIANKDLHWEVNLNYARNKNKVVKLHPDLKEYSLSTSRWGGAMIQAREGQPYGAIIGKKLRRSSEGEVLYGTNGLPLVSDNLEVLGNGVYKWIGGIGTSLQYKSFSLSALLDVKWGADVYSMSSMMAHVNGTAEATLEGRKEWYYSEELRKQANVDPDNWVPVGGFIGNGVVPLMSTGKQIYVKNETPINPYDYWKFLQDNTPEPFIYDASFIKLRELTLTYTLKEKLLEKTFLTGVSFTVYGRNLWTIYSNVPNIDPESAYNNSNGQGLEYGSLPSRRSLGLNVKLIF